MTTTPTRHEVNAQPMAADAPSGPRRPWWKSWRMGLAVLIIVPAFIGQIAGTDDAWPFAPFRMFASPTKRTTSILHPEFYGYFGDSTRVAMFSTNFRIRPAEVESELDRQHHMPQRMLADIAQTYNENHPKHPLTQLDLRMVGQHIIDGAPAKKINRVVQTWTTS